MWGQASSVPGLRMPSRLDFKVSGVLGACSARQAVLPGFDMRLIGDGVKGRQICG
jgi:hypothetical protein